MTSDFDRDTAIEATGPNRWDVVLGDRWSIGAIPNGGYSTTPILRALLADGGRPDPLSVTTHFYKPAIQNEAGQITTEVLRSGRAYTHAGGILEQDGAVRSRTMAVLGELAAQPAPDPLSPPPVSIPDPDDCPARDEGSQGIALPLLEVVDIRLHPDGPGRGPMGEAVLSGWARFHDERAPDSLALAFFADAFPPAVLGVFDNVGWVPSLEITAHVRRQPVAGWIRAEVVTADIQDDLLVEDVRLWDESGALVAQARQLAKPLLKG